MTATINPPHKAGDGSISRGSITTPSGELILRNIYLIFQSVMYHNVYIPPFEGLKNIKDYPREQQIK
jgi:hypothetical protein